MDTGLEYPDPHDPFKIKERATEITAEIITARLV